jgi:integrase/recombinase XerC
MTKALQLPLAGVLDEPLDERRRRRPGLAASTAVRPIDAHLQELVDRFLDAEHAGSPHTVSAYRRHLRDFLQELAGEAPSPTTLVRYRAQLVRDGRGPASHQQAIAAVRGFFTWLGELALAQEQAPPIPLEALRRLLKAPRVKVQRPYRVLAEGDAGALLHGGPTPRDRAMVAVFLGAGLRVDELVRLEVGHFLRQGEDLSLWVRQGKGGKSRTVPILPDVAGLVVAYLEETGRTWGSSGPLFLPLPRRGGRLSRTGRLTTRAVEYRLRKLLEAAGVAGNAISPHSLRHTYAIRFLRGSGNLKALQELLGHASIETTERYLRHLELDDLRADLPALPALTEPPRTPLVAELDGWFVAPL